MYTLENCTIDVVIPANMTAWEFLEAEKAKDLVVFDENALSVKTDYENFYKSFKDQKYKLREDELADYYRALNCLRSPSGGVYYYCENCDALSSTINRKYYHHLPNTYTISSILSRTVFKDDREIINHMKMNLEILNCYDKESNLYAMWPLFIVKNGCLKGHYVRGNRTYFKPVESRSAPVVLEDSGDMEVLSKRSLSAMLDTACDEIKSAPEPEPHKRHSRVFRPACCLDTNARLSIAKSGEQMYRLFADSVQKTFISASQRFLYALPPKLRREFRGEFAAKLDKEAQKIRSSQVEIRQMMMFMSGQVMKQDVTTDRLV